MTTLQTIWFGLIALLFAGYAVLDGFDLGVGMWHLFTRGERERRTLLNAIAPFWDGNEVWLLTAGGALFAAFPPVYASVFSGFYLALMLLLLALILRAVAIEFRAHETSPTAWLRWDAAFTLGSTVAVLLLGVALGNILRGIRLDAVGNYTGGFFGLLNPFALLVGVLNLAMIATHGALYLVMKTEGPLAERARGWAKIAWSAYVPLAAATITVATQYPHLRANYLAQPLLWFLPALALLVIGLAGVWNGAGQPGRAFVASAAGIVLLLATAAAALFPTLVPALGHPEWNLTAHNASSTALTLKTMLILAVSGMVLVLGYTVWVYRTFRGKARWDEGY